MYRRWTAASKRSRVFLCSCKGKEINPRARFAAVQGAAPLRSACICVCLCLSGVFRCCGSVSAEGPLAAEARLREHSFVALTVKKPKNNEKKTTVYTVVLIPHC